MKFLTNIDKRLILENNPSTPQMLDEIDSLELTIDDNLNKEVKIPNDVLNSFKIKNSLNKEIWPNDKLSKEIRLKLIQIAEDFIKDLELPKDVKIKDIIFTGSLANYNWSKYSDIDLHVVIDFDQFEGDEKMIEDFFYAQKSIWNQEHDITIAGYPVEMYVQNINDKLVATSVYSVLHNKWIKKPSREEFNIDKNIIKDKALSIIHNLKDIRQDYKDKRYQEVVDKVTKLKTKIKNMRNAGLERGGELSLENIVFKVLRRTDFMDILDSFKSKSYDNLMSIDETANNTKPSWGATLLIKGNPSIDGKQNLYITNAKNIIRVNKDGEEAGRIAMLGNEILRIVANDNQLKPIKVDWKSTRKMFDEVGLTKNSIPLNQDKTPFYWDTLRSNDIPNTINNLSAALKSIPNINWEK